MADNSIDAQGSELFLSIDATTALKFDCPTAITGLGFSTAEIANGCLDSVNETSRPGRKKLNTITVPFRVQDGSESHEWLLNLTSQPSLETPYAIALSNGTDDPTITAGAFGAPGTAPNYTRTVVVGTGYASGLEVQINDGEVVQGTFSFLPQSQTWQIKSV